MYALKSYTRASGMYKGSVRNFYSVDMVEVLGYPGLYVNVFSGRQYRLTEEPAAGKTRQDKHIEVF